jgi:hypothetical protein
MLSVGMEVSADELYISGVYVAISLSLAQLPTTNTFPFGNTASV